jgi:hypothetical protein
MNEFLKILGKIISKITLSFTYSSKGKESGKQYKVQSVNVYVNNYANNSAKKIGKIDILSGIDDIYANELIEDIVAKVEFTDGTPTPFSDIEFSIEDIYGPVIKKTDKDGVVSFHNIQIKEAGNHRFCIKGTEGVVYKDLIVVKDNPMKLKFISQPQDVASKEVLNNVVVQAVYQSGSKAENLQIQLDISRDGVSWAGTRVKDTNKEGIVCFDNLVFTKTGNYKLKAMYEHTFLYSEPFHVFTPGICMDSEKCEAGSKEVVAFLTALLEKQYSS